VVALSADMDLLQLLGLDLEEQELWQGLGGMLLNILQEQMEGATRPGV